MQPASAARWRIFADGLDVGCTASVKGRRPTMEDAYAMHMLVANPVDAATGRPEPRVYRMFGVFDGHGGHEAALHCKAHLGRNLHKALCQLRHVERHTDSDCVADALRSAIATTDIELLATDVGGTVGTTAVVVLLDAQCRAWVANVGDSRAVLGRSNGEAVQLTTDHKPSCPEERARIERDGGIVVYLPRSRTYAVMGMLSMTRALGDASLRPWVSNEPDVLQTRFDPATDEFLILASDGLWDVLTNQEAVDMLRARACGCPTSPDAASAAVRALVNWAIARGSADNVTATVLWLSKSQDLTRVRSDVSFLA